MPFNGLSPAPKLERAPFGLESVAHVITHGDGDEHWGNGYEQESLLCHYDADTWAMCQVPADGQVEYAAYTNLHTSGTADVWYPVRPWFIQAEDTCTDARALRRPEAKDRLLDVLEALTWKGIERELWTGAHTTADPDWSNPFFAMAGSTVIPVASTPKIALALLIEQLSYRLPGVEPVVHMSPGTAVLLGGELEVDPSNNPNVMRVKSTGTPVAIGTGYAVDANSVRNVMFGTGPITVHVGPSRMITSDLGQGAVVANNEFKLVAERPVAAAFDPCHLVSSSYTTPS